MAAVWKTLKISNLKRLSKKSRKMQKTRRRKQRGGQSNVPRGVGGIMIGRQTPEFDSLNVTQSIPQPGDEEEEAV